MNKKAQWEIIGSPGFVILTVLAISATILGWIFSKKMGASLPVWQIIIIIVAEIIATYFIVARMS